MRALRFAVGVAMALGSVSSAHAEDAHTSAAESFRQGQAAYDRRDYRAAAAAFELAASFEANAVALLDAADAWERANEAARAAEDYDRALATKGITDRGRAYASERLVRLGPLVGTIVVRGEASVTVSVDGDAGGRAPLRRRVTPGHHGVDLEDTANHRRIRRELDVAGGAIADLDGSVVFPPLVPPHPVLPPPSRPFRVPVASWVLGGIALGATAVATVFGVMTLDDQTRFNTDPTQAGADAFNRDRTIANVAWVVTGVAAIAGIVVLVVSASRPKTRVALAPLGIRF